MKIETTFEDVTHYSKTKLYTLDIEGEGEDEGDREVNILKHWYDGDEYEVTWNFEEEKDREWFEDLSVDSREEIEKFIDELE